MEKWITRLFINILLQTKICLLPPDIKFANRVIQGKNIKWMQAGFGIGVSTIPLPRSFDWKLSFKVVMTKVILKMIVPKTPTSKKALVMVILKWKILMYKLFILLVMIHRKASCPILTRRMLQLNSLMFQHFQKRQVYIIFSLKKTSCFVRRRSQIWLVQSISKLICVSMWQKEYCLLEIFMRCIVLAIC